MLIHQDGGNLPGMRSWTSPSSVARCSELRSSCQKRPFTSATLTSVPRAECPSDGSSVFLHPVLYFIYHSLRGKELGEPEPWVRVPRTPVRRLSLNQALSPLQRQSAYPRIPSQTRISPALHSWMHIRSSSEYIFWARIHFHDLTIEINSFNQWIHKSIAPCPEVQQNTIWWLKSKEVLGKKKAEE